ncbi:MAG TPA: potassium-transporting ATPase subunit KdpA [Terriglobales bacterium]|jgi:K+-transporting ATPase A subunit|nr:potassium-transporting ATPase subunit KdpA [Terriglobales bacterium]
MTLNGWLNARNSGQPLWLNPQKFAAIPQDLAFNTAASFATNTNCQLISI